MTTQDLILNFAIILISNDAYVSIMSIKKHVREIIAILPGLGISSDKIDEQRLVDDLRLVFDLQLDRK